MINHYRSVISIGTLVALMQVQAQAQPAEPDAISAEIATEIPVENAIIKLIREIAVPAESAGVLAELTVREGDQVRAGQVIGKIRENKAELEIKRARIELMTAKLDRANDLAARDAALAAEVAENELNRVLTAAQKNADTFRPAEIERFQLVAARAKLQIEQAKHDQKIRQLNEMLAENQYEQVQQALDQCRVIAPWDGMVVAVEATEGKWVEPGTEVVRMIDYRRLKVEGFVSSDHAIKDLMGAQARLTIDSPTSEPRVYQGTVVFVSPDVNPINRQARVFIEVDNSDGELRPGWKAVATILAGTAVVQPAALQPIADGPTRRPALRTTPQ